MTRRGKWRGARHAFRTRSHVAKQGGTRRAVAGAKAILAGPEQGAGSAVAVAAPHGSDYVKIPRQDSEQYRRGGIVQTGETIAAQEIGQRSPPVEIESVLVPTSPEPDAAPQNETYFARLDVPMDCPGRRE